MGRPSKLVELDRQPIHCLEVGRNLRLCGGAIWYEKKIDALERRVVELELELGKETTHETIRADN